MPRTTKQTHTPTDQLDQAPAAGSGTDDSRMISDVDPATLLIDSNARLDPRMDKNFLASIREHGVLQPIVAVRTSGGTIRVRLGHRRTLAAIDAGHPSVPVLIAGDETGGDAGQVERLVQQYAENEHRTGLTDAEHINVVAQLSAFGVSAAQIAKRTRMARPRIDTALKVTASDLAKAATLRYDLTIDQAAVIAEFDGGTDLDTEAVTALVAAAKTGQFDHVAQRARDDRATRHAQIIAAQELSDAGVRVIDRADLGAGRELDRLTNEPGTWNDIEPADHASCPGHAAYLDHRYNWDWNHTDDQDDDEAEDEARADGEPVDEREPDEGYRWVPVWVCTDPAAHGHVAAGWNREPVKTPVRVADMDDEQRDAARAERRDVIDSNQAWASAETVRRDWLKTYLTCKTAPKYTAAFLARAQAQDTEILSRAGVNRLAAELFAATTAENGWARTADLLGLLESATDARAQVIHLGLVLAAYEHNTDRGHWRGASPATRRYLTHLASLGYVLSDVEQRALPTD